MKKIIYFILLIIVGVLVFLFVKKNMKITYKTISEKGVTFEVPEKYASSTNKNWKIYSNKSNDFTISVASSVAANASIDQYISYVKDLIVYGYIEENGQKFTTSMPDRLSDITLIDYSIDRINGIEMGEIVISYDVKLKNKNYRIIEKHYSVINGDNIIQIAIMSLRNEEDKYQAIVDHVVNSIKIQ